MKLLVPLIIKHKITFLLDNVEVGDKLKIDIKSLPDYKKVETAVGGGGVLVCDGIAQTEFSHNVTGRNPRTAVGLDETGTKITFVVLDGRRADLTLNPTSSLELK